MCSAGRVGPVPRQQGLGREAERLWEVREEPKGLQGEVLEGA